MDQHQIGYEHGFSKSPVNCKYARGTKEFRAYLGGYNAGKLDREREDFLDSFGLEPMSWQVDGPVK